MGLPDRIGIGICFSDFALPEDWTKMFEPIFGESEEVNE